MQYTVVGAEATAADPNDRPDLVFKTSDGYITAGTISDSEWQGFCRASGDPELAKDPRFATPGARSVNATARINKMAEYIGLHTTAEWLERLDAADVPCAPILRRAKSSTMNRWWRAVSSRSSISQGSGGCASPSLRPASKSMNLQSAAGTEGR